MKKEKSPKARISDIIFFLSIFLYIIVGTNTDYKLGNVEISLIGWFTLLFVVGIFKNFNIGKFGKLLNKNIKIKWKSIMIYFVSIILYLVYIVIRG